MAEKQANSKEGAVERGWRLLRNINILGAVAVGSVAAVIPGPNVLLASYAGFNVAQAGGFEVLRRHAQNSRRRREKPSH